MTVTKRYVVPKFWQIEVKAKKYVVSPLPGPHSKMTCIPLGVVLRDILHCAHTMNEAKEILKKGFVKINGIVRKEHGFPVGLMDVVDVGGEFYRVLPRKNGINLFKVDTNDVVVIDIEHNLVKETIKFEKGSLAIVTAGNNTGLMGTIESIDRNLRTVVMSAGKEKFIVPIKYVFVIGHGKPVISIGE